MAGAEASVVGVEVWVLAGAVDLAVGAEASVAGAADLADGDLTHSGIHFGTHSGAEASVVGVASVVGAALVAGAAASVAGAVGTLTSLVSGTRTDQFIMVEV